MKSHTKIIAGIATVSALALGSTTPYQDSVTLAELMTIPQIYSYESEKIGTFDIGSVRNNDEVIEKVNNIIENRIPTPDEKITINGQELTADQYKTLREELLPKVEAKSLLERISE